MRKINLPLWVATGIAVVGSTCNATVQNGNPLRGVGPIQATQPQSQQAALQQQAVSNHRTGPNFRQSEMPAEVQDAIYQSARFNQTNAQSNGGIAQANQSRSQTMVDPKLAQTVYEAEIKPQPGIRDAFTDRSTVVVKQEVEPGHSNQTLSSLSKMLDGLNDSPAPRTDHLNSNASLNYPEAGTIENETSELESTIDVAKQGKFDQGRLQLLLKKLAINTGIVMCFGVGFILIAKRFYKPKQVAPAADETKIRIKSTLRLSPKSNLFLVEAGEQRLIVASDQTGIKSVVALTKSFDNTLESLADIAEQPNDLATINENSNELADALGTYSLASVGTQEQVNQPKSEEELPSSQDDVDEVRLRMEAALRKHGLKDIFLKSLEKTS